MDQVLRVEATHRQELCLGPGYVNMKWSGLWIDPAHDSPEDGVLAYPDHPEVTNFESKSAFHLYEVLDQPG